MKIASIQTLTLLDFPGHVAATVFLAGCNFRCHYCHNGEFVLPEKIKKLEKTFFGSEPFGNFLEARQGLLEGVCVTGGEPTIYLDLPDFIAEIKAKNYLVKLDTNGGNPDMLEKLLQDKLLDYVAMDIKASPKRYADFVGTKVDMSKIEKSKNLLLTSRIDYEFRTTLVSEFHDDNDFLAMLTFIKGAKKYYLQNFRSKAGCLNPTWENYHGLSESKLNEYQKLAEKYVDFCGIRT